MVGDYVEARTELSRNGFSEQIFGEMDEILKNIDLIVRKFAVEYRSYPLKSHTGIDIRLWERSQSACLVAVELHENEVPYLYESAAVEIGHSVVEERFLDFEAFAEVVMDLAARAARTCVAHLPEVVVLVQAENMFRVNVRIFEPELLSLVVLSENRDVKARFVEFENFGDEFPCVFYRIFLEVVAERKVSEHFEKRVVTRREADIFKVVVLSARSDALLSAACTGVTSLFEPEKKLLELVHSGICEKQSLVLRRKKRRTCDFCVTFSFEKIQKSPSDFVYRPVFHNSLHKKQNRAILVLFVLFSRKIIMPRNLFMNI